MERDVRFADYLSRVGEKIRWNEARASVLRELEGHLTDQAKALSAGGMEPGQAGEQAVLQMGDPDEVGERLDRIHRPQTDLPLLLALAILAGLGLFLAVNLRRWLTPADNGSYVAHYLVFGGVGLAAMLLLCRLDYKRLLPLSLPLYLAGLVLPVAAMLSGGQANGVARLALFGRTLDVTLPACLLVLTGYAGLLQRARGQGFRGFLRAALLALPPLVFLLLLTRISPALLLGLTLLALLLDAVLRRHFGGSRKSQLSLLLVGGVGVPALLVLPVLPSLLRRLALVFNPSLDPEGSGYQTLMIQRIISSSRPNGLAESEGMYGATLAARLPGAANDRALTFLIGQQGWLWGGLALLAAGLLLWRLLHTSRRSGGYGRFLSLAAGLFLSLRLLLGALTNLGFPIVSLDFPFLSMGGVALVCDLLLCGLVLSVRRRERLSSSEEPPRPESGSIGRLIRWEDGKLILTLRSPRE